MSVTNVALHTAWSDHINDLRPYAATTIQFNRQNVTGSNTRKAVDGNIAWVQTQVRRIAFELDKLHFNTKHVQDRVSRRDRFEAYCVVEKPGFNPHVHIAWYLKDSRQRLGRTIDIASRSCLLLQALNSGGAACTAADRTLLMAWRDKITFVESDRVVNWRGRGWSAMTKCIFSDGWSRYITKEQRHNPEFSDQVFDLNEFHGDKQRCKPTRFFTIDRSTGKQTLDLDAPLVPRR